MLGLQDDRPVGQGVAPVYPVIRTLWKGLKALSDLAAYEVADQILKLAVGQTREIIIHASRMSARFLGSQAIESTIASGLSLTNNKINQRLRRARSNGGAGYFEEAAGGRKLRFSSIVYKVAPKIITGSAR